MLFEELIANNQILTILTSEYDTLYSALAQLNMFMINKSILPLVASRLENILAPLNKFTLLYDQVISLNILKSMLARNFSNLIISFTNQFLLLNPRWTNPDAFSNTTLTQTDASNSSLTKNLSNANDSSNVSYSGFSVDNQDGDFNNTKSQSSSNTNSQTNASGTSQNTTKTQDILGFMRFMNEQTDEWGDKIYYEIKRELLVTLYY